MAAARLQISEDTEARVRAALSRLPAQQGVAARPAYRNLRKRLLDVYAEVAAEGFADAAVQAALRALSERGADFSASAAFDWLCIHQPEALPARFSAGERHGSRGGTVTVLASARPDVDSSAARHMPDLLPATEPLRVAAPSSLAADASSDDRAREKAWIRRFVEEQSSDEEEDGYGAGAGAARVQPHTDESVQEQADHARVQASLAALTDSPQSRQALARELHTARAGAKQAKAAGDAGAQQRAGALIRVVKEQLQRLSISEEECLAALEEGPGAADDCAGPGLAAPAVAEEEDFGSMFDEGAAAALPRVSKAPALSTVLSHAARQPAVPKRGKPAATHAAETRQLPKSMLQQHCARQQWPAPRFERVAAGPAGLTYAVTLTCSLPARRGKRQSHTSTVELPPACATWPSVEEAQNAVAARALFQLLPDQPLHRALLPPYADLWRSWEDAAAASGVDETRDRDSAIAAFVDALLAAEERAGRGGARARRDGDTADATVDAFGVEPSVDRRAARLAAPPDARAQAAQSAQLLAQLQAREQSAAYAELAAQRASLPIAAVREDIAAALRAADTLVVCGETGCGKTTQVPQFLLDDAIAAGAGAGCSIVCTQPRRVAVMSVADRVAFERLEAAPGAPGAAVGYQVRLDAARSAATRLLFCTAGILLRRLHGDPLLLGTSHIVVDEVHERSLQTDLLLTILRDLPARRAAAGAPSIKLVLMSATLDAGFFSKYLAGSPVVSAHGRAFPVVRHYLEDVYDACGYLLPLDSPAALRPPKKNAVKEAVTRGGDRQRAKLVEEGWVRRGAANDVPVLGLMRAMSVCTSAGRRGQRRRRWVCRPEPVVRPCAGADAFAA